MFANFQPQLVEPELKPYPLVRDFMHRGFVAVHASDDIFKAMALLVQNSISGAPVVDAEGHLVGMLSEKDCLRVITQEAYHHELSGGPVACYMTGQPLFARDYSGLLHVADLFLQHPFRKIPVLDEQERLVGIVRRRDVLRVLLEHEQAKEQNYRAEP
jgi:Mg/Co/Ni transporter MgtE